ncbi:MAG: hypothetical protein HFI44_04850 [Lachnospiraceae bacterium]|nr:hypothetical protein [Lachnospiraceae bacterium]GFI03695.1 hypothetical protein IMSAGC005_02535 [Lachnospiraceae bacterium]
MFDKANRSTGYDSLAPEDKDMLNRIDAYAEQVLGDIDPQKTRISFQLDKLKPIMQEIADERGVSLEDIFIRYMDLASVVSAKQNAALKEDLNDAGLMDFTEF